MTDRQLATKVQAALHPSAMRTQREVAAMFGISKSRIFQLEQNAFVKIVRELRDDPEMRRLFEESY